MFIGSIKEQNNAETRVSLTPSIAQKLTNDGHNVLLEKDYGTKAGFRDEEYLNAGAEILQSPSSVYQNAQIILQTL